LLIINFFILFSTAQHVTNKKYIENNTIEKEEKINSKKGENLISKEKPKVSTYIPEYDESEASL